MQFRLIFLILLSSILTALSVSANDKQGYTIELEIEGIKKSEVYLARHYGDKQYYVDTAQVQNEKVSFSSDVRDGGLYLIVLDDKRHCEIILNEPLIKLRTTAENLAGDMEVIKSFENEVFYDFLSLARQVGQKTRPLKEKYKESNDKSEKDLLRTEIKEAEKSLTQKRKEIIEKHPDLFYTALIKASLDPELPEEMSDMSNKSLDKPRIYYYRDHYFDDVDFSDERLLRTPFIHRKLNYFLDKLLIQKPDSIIPYAFTLIELSKQNDDVYRYVLSTITSKYETPKLMGLDEVFVHLVMAYYNKEAAWWMDDAKLYKIRKKASSLNKCLIGNKGIDINLADRSGQYYRLSELNNEFVMLYFWDPDCGHCKKETPKLKAFYEAHKHLDLEIYAINVEVEIDKWEKYIDEHDLQWINVADPEFTSSCREDYYSKTTPALFLLDADKNIIAKNLRSEGMAKFLENHLKKK